MKQPAGAYPPLHGPGLKPQQPPRPGKLINLFEPDPKKQPIQSWLLAEARWWVDQGWRKRDPWEVPS